MSEPGETPNWQPATLDALLPSGTTPVDREALQEFFNTHIAGMEKSDDGITLRLRSDMGAFDLESFRAFVFSLLSTKVRSVRFDLAEQQYVPSGVFGAFAALRGADIAVTLANVSEDVREVLEITKLDELLHIEG